MRIFKIEKTDTLYIVTWRHSSMIVVKYFIVLMFCAILCLFAIGTVFEDTLGAVSAMLLALGGGAYVLGHIANDFFGRTTLVLDENGLESTWTCLSFKQEKQITLDEIRRFDKQGFCGKPTRWHRRLYVICNGKNIGFLTPAGFNTPSRGELDILCDQLNVFLNELKTTEEPEEHCS